MTSSQTPTSVDKFLPQNKKFSKQSKYSKFSQGITPIEEEVKIFESNQNVKNEVKILNTDNAKDANESNTSSKTILESDSLFIRKMTYNKHLQKNIDSENFIVGQIDFSQTPL